MRLTEKSDYHFEHYNTNTSLTYILNKLGQLEDLMEKYEFETIEDLDEYLFNKTPMIYKDGKWQRFKE